MSLGLSNSDYTSGALSPRTNFRNRYIGSGVYGGEGMGGNAAANKIPGTIISYVGGLNRSRDQVNTNAPGAPPPIEELGPYGYWDGNRWGYVLKAANTLSVNALEKRGLQPPSPQEVSDAVKRYWANLPREEYTRLQKQLEALADEQGYTPPPAGSLDQFRGESKSYRSQSGRRGSALSPVQIEEEGLPTTGSYSRQYGRSMGSPRLRRGGMSM